MTVLAVQVLKIAQYIKSDIISSGFVPILGSSTAPSVAGHYT